jgi:hypothetical protein
MMDFEGLINVLEKRFKSHMHRHEKLDWSSVLESLNQHQEYRMMLQVMHETGGEPDVFVYGDQVIYVDFSTETPVGRRNGCYDEEARLGRKKFPPLFSAWGQAQEHGLSLVDEKLYLAMQAVEPLDLKTSSWIDTPKEVRQLGGALFGDQRYKRVFFYHNGADSYYGVRGYRGYFILSM